MRVNLIYNSTTQTGLAQDVHLVRGMWNMVDSTAEFSKVHHTQPQCAEADVNIFFEVVNPSLFIYAGINIWIPNPEWTYETWKVYIPQFDQIWCKTDQCYGLFRQYSIKCILTGWSSLGRGVGANKNFDKAIVLAGKNMFRHPQIVVDVYKHVESVDPLPELHIVCDASRMNVVVPENLSSKIFLHSEMEEKDYNELLNECGLAICISAAEGFGHAVAEAASTGCALLLGDIEPFQEMEYDAVWVPVHTTREFGRMVPLSMFRGPDVMKALDTFIQMSTEKKITMGETNQEAYIKNHNRWVDTMKYVIGQVPTTVYSLDATATPEEDLPTVTIVTPTRDRLKFMEICAGSVEVQCYPADKLEWIVLDDGKDTCEDLIKHIPFARHVLCTPGISVAEKRNMGARLAKHSVIVSFDDDDIYPPNSILYRVSMLMRGEKGCVFCSVLPTYDICNYISFMNNPPIQLAQAERVSEATLAFTKAFWEQKGFDDACRMAEGDSFIRGREHMCREISPQEVIVSLVHRKTTSSRKAPEGMQPNGCHFGFTDELFKMLSEIGA
jgi:hypothetical protein